MSDQHEKKIQACRKAVEQHPRQILAINDHISRYLKILPLLHVHWGYLLGILENISNHISGLLSVILFLLTLTLYLGRINPIDSDGYFLTNDGMKAGKDVFQLFGIIRSNSRDIFRVGEFMTEHNLGKWHHVYDGHGKIFTINGQQIAMFSVMVNFLLLMMNVRTWEVLWAAVNWKENW